MSWSAGPPTLTASPRLSSDGTDWRENGPSARMKRFRSGAASPRSLITGVISSDRAPRSSIVGFSSERKRGSFSKVCDSSPRRSADACAVSFALTMKFPTCARSRASGPSAWSPSVASRASVRFWEARIFSTSSVSRSAGFARWITSFSSAPRPASAVPNSLIRIASRSR